MSRALILSKVCREGAAQLLRRSIDILERAEICICAQIIEGGPCHSCSEMMELERLVEAIEKPLKEVGHEG